MPPACLLIPKMAATANEGSLVMDSTIAKVCNLFIKLKQNVVKLFSVRTTKQQVQTERTVVRLYCISSL